MDFFNIGTGELVFLLLIAILVVGPKRAVELAQQSSRFLSRIQKEWRSVQQDVMAEVRTLQQETLNAVDPNLRDIAEGVRTLEAELTATTESIQQHQDPADDVTV